MAYSLLGRSIASGESEQNLTTWGLWAVLDGIVTASIIAQGGSWGIPATYATGSMVIALAIARFGKARWTWFETMIASMVVICMIIWSLSGARNATIASTAAVVIAGVPQLFEAWEKPEDSPFSVYLLFALANILATAGAKSWSIEERFYPGVCFILCASYLVVMSRKFFRQTTVAR